MTTEKTIKYFSMFSGIGGFEYGIEKADTQTDFECVGFSEIDKYAVSIYEKHYPNHPNHGDATKINTRDLPNFSFLVGGFPCQAFSLAGKRKGFDDTRGTLFLEIARVLKDKKPRYFLLENVKGLLSHDKGKTFQVILGVLADLGYYVQWTVLNSKNYGVPQNRERIFIKGHLRGRCGPEILSLPRTSTETDEGVKLKQLNNHKDTAQYERVYDINGLSTSLNANGGGLGAKTGLYCLADEGLKLKQLNNDVPRSFGDRVYSSDGLARTLCGDGGGLNDKTGLYSLGDQAVTTNTDGVIEKRPKEPLKIATATKKSYDEAFPHDGVRLNHPDGSTGRGRVQKNLAGTLSCDGNWGTVNQDFLIRRLTPVECERLQGFPDDWTRYGKDGELISDTQRYKCCGNAVTTNVIAAIIEEMFP